jgi:peroxiredoxin
VAAPKGRNKIATVTKTLTVGDVAPDFRLRAHDGTEVVLSNLKGRRVVLAFFAFAFTNT